MSRVLRVTTLVLAWLFFVLAVMGAAGYFYRAGNSGTLAISAFAPYLLLLALPAGAGFLIARQWIPAGLAAMVLIGLVAVHAPLWFADSGRGGRTIVVMTANLRLGQADAHSVVAQARQRGVDVLMVQELTPESAARLSQAGLNELLPFHLAEPGPRARGTGLWSRFPLTTVTWPPLSFNRVVARIAVPGMASPPTVVALHVGGPVPSTVNWGLDLKRLPGMLSDLPRDAPVVVGGDFNATGSVAQFRGLLTDGYEDAADQAGAGLARTYPSDTWFPPLLGIDHVLTRGGVATDVETVTIPGSDHRALVARVTLDDTR